MLASKRKKEENQRWI